MKLKRIVAIMVTLAMILVCLPVQAFAATSGKCGDNVRWSLNANGVLYIYGTGPMYDYEYPFGTPSYDPATGTRHPVVPPWSTSPEELEKIKEVYIEVGVTSIGDYAFERLWELEKVTIPGTVTRIGVRAFKNSSKLEKIALPNSLNEIGSEAFYNTAVTEMVFPAGINTVPAGVCYGCEELRTVQFLGPVVDVGSSAFQNCTVLLSVFFAQGLTGRIGSQAFKYCTNLVSFDIPNGVTAIGKEAFRDCTYLSTVVFPDTLIEIGEDAYLFCDGITTVTLPASVEIVKLGAFSNCSNLKNVTVYSDTLSNFSTAFSGCKLDYVHIIGDEPEEKKNPFGGQDELFVVYYDKDSNGWEGMTWSGYVIKDWENQSYSHSGTLDNNINWKLENDVLTLSGTGKVTGVGGGQAPWYGVKQLVKKLVIEEGITDFGSAAFSLNRMTEIEIADTVTRLPHDSFKFCHSLETVTIPASVQETGASLFQDSGVKTVYFEGDAPEFHAAAFYGPRFNTSDDLIVMYPAVNDTWTEEVRQDYGGKVIWVAYCDHNYETVTVEADCITPGTTSQICSKCGDTQVEPGWTPPQGHNYGVDADGNPDFWDTTCDVCGAERVVDKHRPTHSMYRMYNPNSGEHFYTGSMEERQNLEAAGWKYEGVGFTFPATTGKPVYRLYDRDNTKEHLYTMDEAEKDQLLAKGWILEGVAFNSGREDEVAQYRLHNPNATIGAYHFTASIEEKDALIAAGWEYQGIGFYTCWQ